MPIQFSCPQCGKQTVVADQFAGQTGPCAQCGAAVTVPLTAAGYGPGPVAAKGAGGGSVILIIIAVIGVAALICGGLAFLLLMPALNQSRTAARRVQSMNNLKQLGLALHNYHATYNTFPPAVVTDADGTPLYSGRVLLLPFLEQEHIFQQFDRSKAWDSPENQAVSARVIGTFCDPARGPAATRCDYVFVTGTGTIFEGDKATNMSSITDGTANTVMMIQTAEGPTHWAKPEDWNADTGRVPAGNYPGTVMVLMADGSVRMVQGQTMQQLLKPLTVRNDGQAMPGF